MTCKERLVRVLAGAGAAVAATLALVAWLRWSGEGLVCPLWRATGLYCPGCGVSRMCLRLLRLDLAGAFRANPLLLVTAPGMGALLLGRAWRYVRAGDRGTPRWEERTWLALAGVFLLYGVLRNLSALSCLAPR